MSSHTYELEKTIWSESDFDQMGWHDVRVHAVAFRPEIYELWLDLDYIFHWVHPGAGETYFRFWVAPSTLVFTNVHSVRIDIEAPFGGLELQGIERSDPQRPSNAEFIGKDCEWNWRLDCNEGDVVFRSVGYSQFTRRAPTLISSQVFTLDDRGGISFAREFRA